ncbi:MAG: hypothetical protein HC892_00200 [Saprospiraceae bacterium]|nr:hypothetical protein [Saprospiraceae bacterium]
MTVEQLMNVLKALPQDLVIEIWDETYARDLSPTDFVECENDEGVRFCRIDPAPYNTETSEIMVIE